MNILHYCQPLASHDYIESISQYLVEGIMQTNEDTNTIITDHYSEKLILQEKSIYISTVQNKIEENANIHNVKK